MNRYWIAMAASGALLCSGAAGAAEAKDDQATLEQRLEDAQQRLEAAAREIAELTAGTHGPQAGQFFEYAVPGPRRAVLGINLGAAQNGGVRIDGVSPGGPAAEAGVKAGDIVVAVDGKATANGRELVAAVKELEPGQKVALDLKRDGKAVKATLTARAADHLFFAGPGMAMPPLPAIAAVPPIPPMPAMGEAHWLLDAWGDAEFVTLTPKLGRYFGADKGVLVARAPEDSAFGLQDGDVIVAIGGREPQDSRHAMRILRSYQPGESVDIRILRDRKTQNLSAKVPEPAFGNVRMFRDGPRAPPPRPPAPPAPPTAEATES